jgi:3-hydroxyisobutyrate dehydrogenase-like beta-hydroxyacid dehydrogenase
MSDVAASIGFLGVGAIGRPMAERMRARFPLAVWDANAAACNAFGSDAAAVRSAREFADRVEIVFACLPSVDSYRTAVLGPEGLIHGSRLRTFVHVGTTGPALSREMETALAGRGIAMIDAPVSGGPGRAKAGDLMVMASGPGEAFENVEPMLRTFAGGLVYLGATPGAAQTMKLINNMLSAANLAVASEVLVLGVRAGLEPRNMIEVLNGGTGQNSATLTKIPDHVLTRSFDYGGRLELVYKDLALLVREAAGLALDIPMSEAVTLLYEKAMEMEGLDGDMSTVIRPMERAAGVEVAA